MKECTLFEGMPLAGQPRSRRNIYRTHYTRSSYMNEVGAAHYCGGGDDDDGDGLGDATVCPVVVAVVAAVV